MMRNIVESISVSLLALALGTGTAAAQISGDSLAVDTCPADSLVMVSCVKDTLAGNIRVADSLMAGMGAEDSLAGRVAPMAKARHLPNLYELPYSMKTSHPDYKRMWVHTGVLFAGGLTALGVLQLLPENTTAWNKERITSIPFWKRWSYHVRRGPVWDGDNFVFNYILHPYAGAAYYMGARSIGFNVLGSFLYCTAISTLFWEYGIEAFMEIPSIQDLFITPLAGLALGECFYLLKRHIVSHGYRLWGSRLLGNIVAFIIDPVNEVIGLFAGNPCREALKKKGTDVSLTPWVDATRGGTLGFTLNIVR